MTGPDMTKFETIQTTKPMTWFRTKQLNKKKIWGTASKIITEIKVAWLGTGTKNAAGFSMKARAKPFPLTLVIDQLNIMRS